MIDRINRMERAEKASANRKADTPTWRVESLEEEVVVARRAEIDYRFAYLALLTEAQERWVNARLRAKHKQDERASFDGLVALVEARADLEGWDKDRLDAQIEYLTDHLAKGQRGTDRRVDPLAYYRNNTTPKAAFERLDAIASFCRPSKEEIIRRQKPEPMWAAPDTDEVLKIAVHTHINVGAFRYIRGVRGMRRARRWAERIERLGYATNVWMEG
jgi:hypothetical protein